MSEPLIGAEALSSVGDIARGNDWLSQLGDGEIAELYIWMNRQFPEDIGHVQGPSMVNDSMRIRMARDSALINMRSRGNLKVFRSLLQALPDMTWLQAQLAYVEEAHFHRQWRVETPEGLLLMAAENSIAWVCEESAASCSLCRCISELRWHDLRLHRNR